MAQKIGHYKVEIGHEEGGRGSKNDPKIKLSLNDVPLGKNQH